MKLQKILLLCFIPFLSFGQFSDRYLALHKNFKKTDCETITLKFKNGKTKFCGTTTFYEYNGQEYSFLTGEHITYYKNGSKQVALYNIWGNPIIYKNFDKNGVLTNESETILLDTTAKTLNESLEENEKTTFITEQREYRISKKDGKRYLFKRGKYKNGRKIGTWTYYYPDGRVKKEKIKMVYNKEYNK